MKTIPSLFEESVEKFSDNVLLWEKRNSHYKGITYQETKEEVYKLAAALIENGVQKGDRIALISEGRNHWVISELAIFYCGAICVPLSVKIDEPSDLQFRLAHSGCKGVVISGNHKHKIFEIQNQLPELEFVILLDKLQEEEKINPKENLKVFIMDELLEAGNKWLTTQSEVLDNVWRNLNHNEPVNICYTSGTTADPKGIMLTHTNYLTNVDQGSALFDIPEYFTSLHILPWDHSFAHTVGIYSLIRNGASLASLKLGKTPNETLRNIPICIKEVRPYFMLSVPALAKNFRKNIEKGVMDKGPMAWKLFSWGLNIAYAYNQEGYNKGKGLRKLYKPLYALFDAILFKKIRQNFGGRLKFFVGGGALLDIELQRFFYAIGIPMYQGYGLTEASPIISSNTPDAHKLGSSGKTVPFMEIKICDEKGNELPIGQKGEIVIKGGNVMLGYWKNETATAETIKDGWLFTGDLGYLDSDGYLYVLGRNKSLLIGSDGEKYSPEGIEEAIVEKSPFIDQIMLYNNQNTYTTAIVVPAKAALSAFVNSHHASMTTSEGREIALKKLQSEINRFMPGGEFEGMFPPRWLPAAIAVVDEAFTEQNHMVNSTMKIVRNAIVTHFRQRIDLMYTPDGKDLLNDQNMSSLERLYKASTDNK